MTVIMEKMYNKRNEWKFLDVKLCNHIDRKLFSSDTNRKEYISKLIKKKKYHVKISLCCDCVSSQNYTIYFYCNSVRM